MTQDKAMEEMACWETIEHIKKCAECREEAMKIYNQKEDEYWKKQKSEEESVMYANNDCERD